MDNSNNNKSDMSMDTDTMPEVEAIIDVTLDKPKKVKTKTKAVLVNLDPNLYAKLRRKAKEDGSNATAVARKLIQDWVGWK